MADEDFVMSLLSEFCRLTGRLTATCADYALATAWEAQGMPLSIALRGIDLKLKRCQGKRYVPTMPLSWCADDVNDTYRDWRRAVGPSRQRVVENVSHVD